MSVGTGISPEQAPSPSAAPEKGQQGQNTTAGTTADQTSETENARPVASTDLYPESEGTETAKSTSSLLSSLWSPIGSLLQSTKTVSVLRARPEPSNEITSSKNGNTTINNTTNITNPELASASPSDQSSSSKTIKSTHVTPKDLQPSTGTEPGPEAYYTPTEVPLFKALQKKRLSGTRTKQLLRAASRAYDDPPPPPELGSCCGSSCDPCVNDLWREERDVWRERWGDRRVEGDGECSGSGRKELEW